MEFQNKLVTVFVGNDVDIWNNGLLTHNLRSALGDSDIPDSFPTPIWLPTEYMESRFDIARMAR